MPAPAHRFTIRGLLIAIGVIAGLLAIPDPWRILAFALLIPGLSLIQAGRLQSRGELRAAAIGFWATAIVINALYTACCTFPGLHLVVLDAAWLVLVLPLLGGFGWGWARLASRDARESGRSASRAWLAVIALTLMPLVTSWTAWPFRLSFLTARPSLDRLADRVAAGRPVSRPEQVGPFRIVGSAFDAASGSVGLMVDANPGGPSGFVRVRRRGVGPFGCFRPFRGDWFHLDLVGGWCFHEED